jgi:hypothetical protein
VSGGGLSVSQNRTAWPISGGAVAWQPGWFMGHSTALTYINMGLGEIPSNYSLPMMPMFQVTGPTNDAFNGTVCLPQVQLPKGVVPRPGDKASIQLVQAAKHGAALFSVSKVLKLKLLVSALRVQNCKDLRNTTVSCIEQKLTAI